MNVTLIKTPLSLLIFYSFFSVGLFLSNPASASEKKDWKKIFIEEAQCGNGDPYFIWIRPSSNNQWTFIFEGGGVCWDAVTCTTDVATRLKQDEKINLSTPFLSPNLKNSVFADKGIVFLPYCTGDLFAGTFEASYAFNTKVKHFGRNNTVMALQKLKMVEKELDKENTNIIAYGYSAGAIGLMMNFTDIMENFGTKGQIKRVILDGMGLHWDASVWNRFSKKLLDDLKAGFARMNTHFDAKDWPLAKKSLEVCRQFPQVQFAILQGSMDIVMGTLFGFDMPPVHRARVYGREGIWATLKDPSDNCTAFVPDTFAHTFLNHYGILGIDKKSKDGTSAIQFVRDFLKNGAKKSVR